MLMPMLSAILPYLTAFIQVVTEGANALANMLGFELPKINLDSVTNGYDDITAATEEATAATEKFKGSLAGVDQLNIIGSKNTSGGDGEPRRTILRDEGSTNGTRYNYEKLEPEVEVELHDGDIFQAGGIELVYHSGEASHAEASRVGSVINLEETGAAERSTSVMKNMGTRTGVRKKGGADIRDSHAQKTVMMAIIAILALGALGAIGYLLLTMFGGK